MSTANGKMSKDKKTVLRLALNLHVLFFALDLGEEIAGRVPTTVPMVISEETMKQAVELTRYFAAQRGVYEKVSSAHNCKFGLCACTLNIEIWRVCYWQTPKQI